ncbi:MAG: hypothetical protein E6G51_06285 [Actinobacteria bacterium]|nr:MAG: hypothetical protein E6G51_06285 [Actinomycetota bacterium]
MLEKWIRNRVSNDRQGPARTWGACVGAAVLGIATALVSLTALLLLLDALGVSSAPESLAAAGQDAVVALYAVQLVGLSFFNGTAELRFAAVPGLLLVGASLAFATFVAVRAIPGSPRRKMTAALGTAFSYALLLGIVALFVPLELSAPGIGKEIAVSPSPVEAFLLPLGWGVLFALAGGLLATFGREWRRAASGLLGEWARPLAASLRVLAAALAASAVVALFAGLDALGADLGSLTSGGVGHAFKVIGATIVALPSLAAAVFVSGFGVPFDWQLDALGHGEGSVSAFGGALPAGGGDVTQTHGAPAVLALAPAIALAAVFALGWLAARRSGADVRRGLLNTLRAAAGMTAAVWVLALLGRVDAQIGGLLGFHLVPDVGVLLWRVPLVTFLGCFAGSFAYALAQGAHARRRLATTLLAAVHPANWRQPQWVQEGMTWRAALGVGFAAIPVLLIGLGATGPSTSAAPEKISLAPLEQAAEQRLEKASTNDEVVDVTVNPETRAVGTASVHTPLRALGIPAGGSRAEKAEEVLVHYGDLFGLDDAAAELGKPESSTDKFGVTHITFEQMAAGHRVFGGGIGVHLTEKAETLDFVSGSVIPNVIVAEDEPKLSSGQALKVAKEALPSGNLARPDGKNFVQPPSLQVYAGVEPYVSGPNARLAWFVWLVSEKTETSEEYVVDAVTGEILDTIPKAHQIKFREVYDYKTGPTLPGVLVRQEKEEAVADTDVNYAYDNTGTVYDFYEGYERDSYDDKGAPLVSTVHFKQASGAAFKNAYWNGEQMVFGDKYPKALDIVGHEITHAVVENSAELLGSGQAGALNEGFSDIIGATVEMEKEGAPDWVIGEDLPTGPIRSLSNPAAYSEPIGEEGASVAFPSTLSQWVATCLDNFGIHINSTIVSHAFYIAATKLESTQGMAPVESAFIFYRGVTEFLGGNQTPTLEDSRAAILKAAENMYGLGSPVYETVKAAFTEVGLNGTAQPTLVNCKPKFECAFAQALQTRQSASGESAVEMLTTLYKARGELALNTPAGDHFLPLYESHMVRITELVNQDPELAEMSVAGLEEITPALDALIEGHGDEFKLSADQMGRIEAALQRLAEDDRLYGGEGAGQLADLIDEELQWMGLPSYGGMDYESGFQRLNTEVESQSLTAEGGPILDPNCTGKPYPNDFHVNGFYADTPGANIPGQVAPFIAGGIICGAEVEPTTGKTGCIGENSLNTEVSVKLPPGDKVNSTKNLPASSWVGELVGFGIACAGAETQRIYGQVGLLSLASWTSSQCPTTAIACYEGRSTFNNGEGSVTGKGWAWISEEAGVLKLTTKPVTVTTENGYFVRMSFGQFEAKLCGRAGTSASKACGGSTATWIHQNGEAAEPGCPTTQGRFEMQAKNAAGKSTVPVTTCVRWDKEAHMQTIDAPNSINAVSCVPASTTCVVADSKGNAFYSTGVKMNAASSWTSWTGPGVSPAHDIACPATTLCVLAAGEVSGGGGNVYRATALGGTFLNAFNPTNGVGAFSCPSTVWCVSAHEGGGYIRWTAKPSGTLWTAVAIGTGAMKDVACLSSSFCAVVDATGNVRVATSEAKIKEAAGWTATSVNGGVALSSVACTATTNCIAVGNTAKLLKLTIAAGGGATVSSQTISGAGELSEVTCTGATCVATDNQGRIFASSNSGTSWTKRFEAGGKLMSVSCASASLCVATTNAGDLIKFDPLP